MQVGYKGVFFISCVSTANLIRVPATLGPGAQEAQTATAPRQRRGRASRVLLRPRLNNNPAGLGRKKQKIRHLGQSIWIRRSFIIRCAHAIQNITAVGRCWVFAYNTESMNQRKVPVEAKTRFGVLLCLVIRAVRPESTTEERAGDGTVRQNKNKKKKGGRGGRLLLRLSRTHWTYGRLLLRLSRTHCNRPPAPPSGSGTQPQPLFLQVG